MKFSIITVAAFALPLTSALSFPSFGSHSMRARSHEHKHMAAARRDIASSDATPYSERRRAAYQRRALERVRLQKRKTPGEGDSTTQPDNLADGSFGAAQGCKVWHTIAPGEVCLGLIDKSSPGFDINAFHKYNPQVGSDCSNLVDGQAYCVDTVIGGGGATEEPTPTTSTTPKTTTAAATRQLVKVVPTTSSIGSANDANDDDCDDDSDDNEPDTTDNGDDDDCDDDDDSGDDEGEGDDDGEDCDEDDGGDGLDEPVSSQLVPIVTLGGSSPTVSRQGQQKVQATSTSDSDEPASTGTSSSSIFSGVATYFYQNGNAGACGNYNQDSKLLVALQTSMYASGAHCGASVKLTNTATGQSVVAEVQDECPTCETHTSVDCSIGVFQALSPDGLGPGVLDIKWEFV